MTGRAAKNLGWVELFVPVLKMSGVWSSAPDTIETNLDTLNVSPCGWFGLDRDFLCKIDALSDFLFDYQSEINQDTLYLHSALSTWHVAEAEPSQCRQKMSSKRDFFEL